MNKLSFDVRQLLDGAIIELASQGICGGIYDYKKNECSCCYGLQDVFYQIQGNTAMNQEGGCAGRVTFTFDIVKAKIVYNTIKRHLENSKYKIVWGKNVYECMFINLKK